MSPLNCPPPHVSLKDMVELGRRSIEDVVSLSFSHALYSCEEPEGAISRATGITWSYDPQKSTPHPSPSNYTPSTTSTPWVTNSNLLEDTDSDPPPPPKTSTSLAYTNWFKSSPCHASLFDPNFLPSQYTLEYFRLSLSESTRYNPKTQNPLSPYNHYRLEFTKETLRSGLTVGSDLLTHYYNLSLSDLEVPEVGPVFARAMSESGLNDEYFNGPREKGDTVTMCEATGGGWEGSGAGELLGVWNKEGRGNGGWLGPSRWDQWDDTGNPVTHPKTPVIIDLYDIDTKSLKTTYDTAIRCICLQILLHGEVSVRKDKLNLSPNLTNPTSDEVPPPPNLIPTLNVVRYVGEADVIESSNVLTTYGELVGEMLRAIGEATSAGWGGGGTNNMQKVYGEEWEGGVCGRILDILEGNRDSHPNPTELDKIVNMILCYSPIQDRLFSGTPKWNLFYSVVMESLIDQKRPAKAVEFFEAKFGADPINAPKQALEAFFAACAAQAYLERKHGTGEEGKWAERAFTLFDAAKVGVSVWEKDLLTDRMTTSLLKCAEFSADYLRSIELITSSRFASTDGTFLNDADFIRCKGEALGSVLSSCADAGQYGAGASIAAQLCSGPEKEILFSSDYALAKYMQTLIAQGKYEEAVESFTGAVELFDNVEPTSDSNNISLWKDSVEQTVTALGFLGEITTAFSLVKGLQRHVLTNETFHCLMLACIRGGKPGDVYGVFHYAERTGCVDDVLCSNAIIAFSQVDSPKRWEKVEEYMKKMEVVRMAKVREFGARNDPNRLAAPSERNQNSNSSGPGRGKVFWWVDALVEERMSDELKLVFCKMCRGLRDQALAEKFLQSLEANGETLDGNSFKILVQMCGQGVRRKSCRGEPLFEVRHCKERSDELR
ncbi:hypothetical protein TL16_g05129 [Triparma laevis f. inornata]|uniref:Uncharacterized protein n=1 Tax=Triparma laevis f. inornata TaxID=1714386 RepID=A0A9W7AH56_9STRA|nr:hypothetical protein TL16_g05129 [Triparma laevis f. inornata]